MKHKIIVIIISLFFLTGLGLVSYPMLSDWYISYHQAEIVAEYDEQAAKLSEQKKEEELEKARKYNESLLGNVVLTDPFDAEALEEQNSDYDDILNLNGDSVMGSIEIPQIDVYLPIYHGTGGEALKKGAGHLKNSSFPVGGTGTHSVISGHTALPSAKLFNDLIELDIGDVFYIHVLDETLAYEIDQTKVVRPEDTSDLLINKNEDYVTLVTCTPYGINSHRLLVRGTRIPYQEAEKIAEKRKAETGFDKWDAYYLTASLAAILIAAGIFHSWRKKKKNSRKSHEK